MIKKTRAFICGISGHNLKKSEVSFLKKYKPWGIILFSRNIKTINQVQKLTGSIKKIFKNANYPILIDEEGGNVSRLSHLMNNKDFSQNFFGKLFEKNNKNGKFIYHYYLNSICSVLKRVGININTIPVMDLLQSKTHKIIGERK